MNMMFTPMIVSHSLGVKSSKYNLHACELHEMDLARDSEVLAERERESYRRLRNSEMARLEEFEQDMGNLEQDLDNLQGLVGHFQAKSDQLEQDAAVRQTVPASRNADPREPRQILNFQEWMGYQLSLIHI